MARKSGSARSRSGLRNAFSIGALAFVVSLFFSGPAQHSLQTVDALSGVLFLFIIIGIAVFFDIIAVAVAAAEETPFHAMASNRVPGAREAVYFVRHAERVNSLCGDVIGDICGTVSGALAAPVILDLSSRFPSIPIIVISMVIIGLIAAFTVGGKAWTKGFALSHANRIIGAVGKSWYWCKRILPLPAKFKGPA